MSFTFKEKLNAQLVSLLDAEMTSDEFDDLQSLLRVEPRAMQQYVKLTNLYTALRISHQNCKNGELENTGKNDDSENSLTNSREEILKSKACLPE